MTTFVLHGGKTSITNSQNELFFGQFAKLVDKHDVTVLLCYFAREKEEWDALSERDSKSIKNNTEKKITIEVAESPADLLQKIDTADVLYVAGGESLLIEPTYKELEGLGKKLEGKVYAGSSMGAFMISEQYVLSLTSQEKEAAHPGLGLLPIQLLCHWDKEIERVRKLNLLHETSDRPVLVLNEFEFTVFYK